MDYGQPGRFGAFVIPEATDRPLQVAAVAEELGFDLLGVQDHPYQRRFYDTMTLLTAIALSGGRFELGLGAGGFWEGIKAYDGLVRTPGESVSALEEAIQVIRLLWSGQHSIRFDGKFYHLEGAHSGPVPAHPIGIWLGAYKPRMLSLVGRLADGWVPSLGYVKPDDLLEANARIDEAAAAAGREPGSIRRALNAGRQDAA